MMQGHCCQCVSDQPPFQPWISRRLVPTGQQASYFGTETGTWSAAPGAYYNNSSDTGITTHYYYEVVYDQSTPTDFVVPMYPMRFEAQVVDSGDSNNLRVGGINWAALLHAQHPGLESRSVRQYNSAPADTVQSGGHFGDEELIAMKVPFLACLRAHGGTNAGYYVEATHVRFIQNGVAVTDPLPVSGQVTDSAANRRNQLRGNVFMPWHGRQYLEPSITGTPTFSVGDSIAVDVWMTLYYGGIFNETFAPAQVEIGLYALSTSYAENEYIGQAGDAIAGGYYWSAGQLGLRGPEAHANFNYASHTYEVTFPDTTNWTATNSTTWKIEDGSGWTVTERSQAVLRAEFGERAYFLCDFRGEMPEIEIYDPDGEVMAGFGGLGVVAGGPTWYRPNSGGTFESYNCTWPVTGTTYEMPPSGLFLDDGTANTFERYAEGTNRAFSGDPLDSRYYLYEYKLPIGSGPVPIPGWPFTVSIKRVNR